MKKVIQKNFYLICFLLFVGLTLTISPLGDDWYYKTAPNIHFTLQDLLPARSFWRPFDAVFGMITGFVPRLFPYINRICVIFGHILNVYLLKKILELLNIKNTRRSKAAEDSTNSGQIAENSEKMGRFTLHPLSFAILFAMFSSSVYATVLSPDALNQVFSLLFGLLGIYLYLKDQNTVKYIIMSAISLFWKESGIVWICIIPFIDIMFSVKRIKDLYKDRSVLKRIIKSAVIAVLFVIIYFTARFTLFGAITLGSSGGKHALSFFSPKTVKNFINIFANALSGLDTIALFVKPVNYILLGITALLSVIFAVIVLWAFISKIKNKEDMLPLFTMIVTALVTTLPHVIMGQAGEMHVYPTVFMIAAVFAFLFKKVKISGKALCAGMLSIFIAFGISGVHKLVAIYEYSNCVKELTEEMHEIYDPDKSLLVISADQKSGYSVYSQSAAYGSYYGYSLKPYYGWKELKLEHEVTKGQEELDECIEMNRDKYDVIWVISDDRITVVD